MTSRRPVLQSEMASEQIWTKNGKHSLTHSKKVETSSSVRAPDLPRHSQMALKPSSMTSTCTPTTSATGSTSASPGQNTRWRSSSMATMATPTTTHISHAATTSVDTDAHAKATTMLSSVDAASEVATDMATLKVTLDTAVALDMVQAQLRQKLWSEP